MKYLKKYEDYDYFKQQNDTVDMPKNGEYVIAIPGNLIPNSKDFFTNTIGKIVKAQKPDYAIEYENIPKNIRDYYCNWRINLDGTQYQESIIWFTGNLIKHHSKSKEDLEPLIAANKYNL